MSELPNDEVLDKLAIDMYRGENAVDYWEVATCVWACAQAAKRDRLRWTREPPTKPGWYWVTRKPNPRLTRYPGEESEVVQYVQARQVETEGQSQPFECFDLWAGPIEAPPLPEEK